jgi:hypothetical protein
MLQCEYTDTDLQFCKPFSNWVVYKRRRALGDVYFSQVLAVCNTLQNTRASIAGKVTRPGFYSCSQRANFFRCLADGTLCCQNAHVITLWGVRMNMSLFWHDITAVLWTLRLSNALDTSMQWRIYHNYYIHIKQGWFIFGWGYQCVCMWTRMCCIQGIIANALLSSCLVF